MAAINVVGGGIAGLVASIACAEAGAEVRRLRLRSKPAYNIETGLLCDSSQTTKWSRHPGRRFFMAFLTSSGPLDTPSVVTGCDR
jgi:hypothetical protein